MEVFKKVVITYTESLFDCIIYDIGELVWEVKWGYHLEDSNKVYYDNYKEAREKYDSILEWRESLKPYRDD